VVLLLAVSELYKERDMQKSVSKRAQVIRPELGLTGLFSWPKLVFVECV